MTRREPVPAHALHAHYASKGAYLDCYATRIEQVVTHAEFIEAFYTTWLFRLERWILAWSVRKPSTDAQARELSLAQREDFAAWTLEARDENQLLMCDFMRRTRSWLMVSPCESGTTLYFGSVVTSRTDARTGRQELGRTYRLLLGFHKLYARALLGAARRRLRQARFSGPR